MPELADIIALRVLYVAAILGAGAVGALVLFVPKIAKEKVFYGAVEPDVYTKILGALWLGLGITAAIGLVHPLAMAGVLLVQMIYKALWLAFAAYPAIIAGRRDTALLFLAVLFTVWAIAIFLLFPFAVVFGGV